MKLWLIGLLACTPEPKERADGEVVQLPDNDEPDTPDDGEEDADDDPDLDDEDDEDDDDAGDGPPSESDVDGDGYQVGEGDCDDSDPSVHPGVLVDACDGIDNDCDGRIDENFGGDDYEPNDVEATYLGTLDGDGFSLQGYMSPSSDIDIFQFYVDDSWFDWFDIEITLSDVASSADYGLELYWVADDDGESHGLVDESDSGGTGEDEFINYSYWWGDAAGRYEAIVSSNGAGSCHQPYRLEIVTAGFR